MSYSCASFLVFLLFNFHVSWGLCQSGSRQFIVDVVSVGSELIADAHLLTLRNLTVSTAGLSGTELSVDPVCSSDAGLMKISSTSNRVVRISFIPNEIIYSDQNDSGKVEVEYKVSGCSIENQSASVPFETPNSTVTLHEISGSYFLWIGGNFNLNNARSGRYKSQFVLTIDEL